MRIVSMCNALNLALDWITSSNTDIWHPQITVFPAKTYPHRLVTDNLIIGNS
jgi:hypothetical protein